jgi:hypothetical protein
MKSKRRSRAAVSSRSTTIEVKGPEVDTDADANALLDALHAMGLSAEDLEPPSDGNYDRRIMARVESAQIVSRRVMERELVKESMKLTAEASKMELKASKQRKQKKWAAKCARSPFTVDLVAENERVDEENRVREREEGRRQRVSQLRQERAKSDIILQSLGEINDLDALRREKRAIIEEERRIKALMDLEKASAHRKEQVLAVHRAERARHQAIADYRRGLFTAALEDHNQKRADLLRQKHGLQPPGTATSTFSSSMMSESFR